MSRTARISAETWVDTAKQTLIDEGVGGVKVDRLASRLGVTRGGFYHHFRDRDDLLEKLIDHWESSCRFLPDTGLGSSAADGAIWFEALFERLLEEDGYDPRFDLALRDWARIDQRAAWAIERSDRDRLGMLANGFKALGYGEEEARIRARVLYYHQIGYYAMGVREGNAERRRALALYNEILCGAGVLASARADPAPRKKAAKSATRGMKPSDAPAEKS